MSFKTNNDDFATSAYNYELPENLIAQSAVEPRDKARLLVLSRTGEIVAEDIVHNLDKYLPANSTIVLNEAKVIPARFFAKRISGGKVEVLILRFTGENTAEALMNSRKPLKIDDEIFVTIDCQQKSFRILSKPGIGGVRELRGENCELNIELLEKIGRPPLPPYIKRENDDKRFEVDKTRYQTVFANKGEAVAAPTAGLHFTKELLERIEQKFKILKIVLNVGLGTFQPVRVDDVRTHKMHTESYEITHNVAQELLYAKNKGFPIITIGTTTVRTLETAAQSNFAKESLKNNSEIFIYPGFNLKMVDGLMTNFHLPSSTLIMMLAAFIGRERILEIYRYAVEQQYRFYSYGDAMFIMP